MSKDMWKKAIAVLLCVFFVLSSGGCNIAEQIRNSVHDRITVRGEVSIQEITRLLVSSINDNRKTADAYSRIPESQTDGISYSYFFEYMSILRSVSTQNNGRVSAFRLLSDSECSSILGLNLISRYGGQIKGAQLLYSNETEYPFYIFFKVLPNGSVSLSKDWVTSIINIYNYGNHYFTLLEERNADAVKALLYPGLIGDEYTDEVVYAKAQQLCDFYRLRVMSDRAEYEITTLLPNEMEVRIPETIAPDGTLFEDHIVILTLQNNGNYSIEDRISAAADVNLLYLVKGDERLMRVGNEYSYEDIISILGTPSNISVTGEDTIIMVLYSGVLLRFDGEAQSETEWTGNLVSIRLLGNSAYSIGYSLYVGMSRSQMLIAYPFIDETGYEISINTGSHEYDVVFVFGDDDLVQSVKVYG